jgi:hypothetical protein
MCVYSTRRGGQSELSVQSDEDKIELESEEEMNQQQSDDEVNDSPLARHTRKAQALYSLQRY